MMRKRRRERERVGEGENGWKERDERERQNLSWSLWVFCVLGGPVCEGCVQGYRSGPERQRCHWELQTGKVCNLP